MRLLLVEDDPSLSDALSKSLRNAGYAVSCAPNGKQALLSIETGEFELVILDLGLPDMDGLELLKRAKTKAQPFSTLILTARDSISDKIDGLDAGADDYLAKPFDMEELFARIRVIQRRFGTALSSIITIDGVTLNVANHQLSSAGVSYDLARREFMLLKSLMENAGRIQNKTLLEQKLYEWGEELTSNAIEVHIHNLRKKLPKDFVKTVRGVGYMIPKSAPAPVGVK